MAQVITNSGHDDMIHDAVLDYYGRRLATSSSDKTIKIFDIEDSSNRLSETLRGHEGAVWSVAWAHPKFGTILASSSFDGRVLIWRSSTSLPSQSHPGHSQQQGGFQKVFESSLHSASVNLVAWAPHEAGCVLACASSDGAISVLEFDNNAWTHVLLPNAHAMGVNAVSWAPASRPGAIVSAGGGGPQGMGSVRRFVSGGSDCLVKIWEWSPEQKTYNTIQTLTGHSDWVRDVAWSPSVLLKSYIATASQDKTLRIWTTDGGEGGGQGESQGEWKCTMIEFDSALWRTSWSLSGNVLAVSQSDNKVSLWKENLGGEWEKIRDIDE